MAPVPNANANADPSTSHSHASTLSTPTKPSVLTTLTADPSLTPHTPTSMLQITQLMLANNPFVAPAAGCPVNALPPELLAHIFAVGTQMEAEECGEIEEDDERDNDSDDGEGDVKDGWTTDEEDVDPAGLDAAVVARLRATGKVQQRADGAMDVDGEEEEEEEEEEDEGDWEGVRVGVYEGEEEEERVLPFQVLVSHVCRHWRAVAIETPALWTRLTFMEGAPYEKSKIWIQRAKGGPLDIDIDCTVVDEDEDDVDVDVDVDDVGEVSSGSAMASSAALQHAKEILYIIVPLVAQWRSFDVTTGSWRVMHMVLSWLSKCPSAPLLESLGLYHCEDNEDYEAFSPAELKEPILIFNGNAPKLRDVLLWGVHLDWDRSLTLLSDLRDLKLSYHAEDVRPSFATFSQIINSSPNLRNLDLCLSGPREHDPETNDWGTEIIEIPSLTDLVFCYHAPAYAIALLKRLSVANVHSLALDFDEEDYTEVVKQLTLPMPKTNKSILVGLEHMKISGLPCNRAGIELMLGQLAGLKTLNINCSNEEEQEIFRQLFPTSSGSTTQSQQVHCPNLYKIIATGVSGSEMCSFVEARNAAGVPIKQVMMSEEDEIDEGDIRWLREHVEELDFFEPSDDEFVDDEDEFVEEFTPWF